MGEDFLRHSNKIESSDLRQCPVFKRYHSTKHLGEFYPQNGGENQLERNYATVTLCIGG